MKDDPFAQFDRFSQDFLTLLKQDAPPEIYTTPCPVTALVQASIKASA